MDDSDADDWRAERPQRIARWVMLLAIVAVLVVAVSGTLSIVFTR